MKLVVAITGASGSLYAQRLLQVLHDDPAGPHEVHVALSSHAREVAEALAHEAHEICPYSKATRGNIDVVVNVV